MIGFLLLNPKTFSSGRVGYFGQGKLEVDGDSYRCQAQMVKVGDVDNGD